MPAHLFQNSPAGSYLPHPDFAQQVEKKADEGAAEEVVEEGEEEVVVEDGVLGGEKSGPG